MVKKRGTFGSRFGVIVAVAGSVVGLGNIWRFPYIAGENGGAAFILVYICISLLIAVPVMLSEFVIGRSSKRNAVRAFKKLAPGSWWPLIGMLGITCAFVIISFYSVVAGWALEFLREALANKFAGQDATSIKANFDAFVASGWRPILWALLFIAGTAYIVMAGVEKGIEKYNKVLMPMMIVVLIGLVLYSVTLDGFKEGAAFLFHPDFSKINFSVVLQALGQAFFSLSLGMGAMITYGSYIKKSENMFRIAGTVALADVSIAILSGLAIFPAVFTFDIGLTSGPELVFLTLPNIFGQMSAGYIVSVVFFLLLFIAAITSSVSLLEVISAYMSEELQLGRKRAVLAGAAAIAIMATLCALSQMPDSSLTIAGLNLFDLFDTLSSVYMMPIGGFFITIFAGWIMSRQRFRTELTSDGMFGARIYPIVRGIIRYFAPLVIALLFLNQLGIVK